MTISGWKTSPTNYTGNATLETLFVKVAIMAALVMVHLVLLLFKLVVTSNSARCSSYQMQILGVLWAVFGAGSQVLSLSN